MVHNIDCSGHTGKYAMKEGFSLVEVIIAVALLGLFYQCSGDHLPGEEFTESCNGGGVCAGGAEFL